MSLISGDSPQILMDRPQIKSVPGFLPTFHVLSLVNPKFVKQKTPN